MYWQPFVFGLIWDWSPLDNSFQRITIKNFVQLWHQKICMYFIYDCIEISMLHRREIPYLIIYLSISATITGKSDCPHVPHVPQVPTALFSCARKAEKHSLSVVQMFSCPLFLCIGARRVIQEIGSWPTAYRFWWVASRNVKWFPTICRQAKI